MYLFIKHIISLGRPERIEYLFIKKTKVRCRFRLYLLKYKRWSNIILYVVQ